MNESTFNSIKKNKAQLRQFIAGMPKGGDLHNHLIGAVYAETLFDIAYTNHYYVDLDTGQLSVAKPNEGNYIQLIEDTFKPDAQGNKKYDFHLTRIKLIDMWSIRDFQPYKYALGPDEYFFSLFGNFIAAAGNEFLNGFVHELKVRAKEENLQYIETIGIVPSVPDKAYLADYDDFDKLLTTYNNDLNKDILGKDDNPDAEIRALVLKIIKYYEMAYLNKVDGFDKAVNDYHDANDAILAPPKKLEGYNIGKFDTTSLNADDVIVKLQGYASRNKPPLIVLCQLYFVYKSIAIGSDSLVGCNLVAAENSEYSMQFYRTHMIMLDVLNQYFNDHYKDKNFNLALHAGELTMGLIPPEHLTYHVDGAVNIAKAKRIGHGVDIAFEHDSDKILNTMKNLDIPIEINLTSNEFILGVKDDAHPFSIYKQYGVPIIISTDDPGILRTSITEEYTLAVYRYDLSLSELRQIVINSIKYSFLSKTDNDDLEDSIAEKFDKYVENYPYPQSN